MGGQGAIPSPATFFTNICIVSAGSGEADRAIVGEKGMVIWIWSSRGRVKGGRDKHGEALTRLLPTRGLRDEHGCCRGRWVRSKYGEMMVRACRG